MNKDDLFKRNVRKFASDYGLLICVSDNTPEENNLMFKHQKQNEPEQKVLSDILRTAKENGQEPDQDENGNKLKASCLNCGTPTEKYLMNKRNYFCCNNCEEEHQKPTLYATDDLKQLADNGIKKLCEGLK